MTSSANALRHLTDLLDDCGRDDDTLTVTVRQDPTELYVVASDDVVCDLAAHLNLDRQGAGMRFDGALDGVPLHLVGEFRWRPDAEVRAAREAERLAAVDRLRDLLRQEQEA